MLERLYSQKQIGVMVSLCIERELNQNPTWLCQSKEISLECKDKERSLFFFPLKVRALDGIHIYNIMS